MPCERIHGRDGSVIIVCSRTHRPRPKVCSGCGRRTAELLCDWPNPRKKSGTCDAPLCQDCTFRPPGVVRAPFPGEFVDETYDLCPKHAEMWRQANEANPK